MQYGNHGLRAGMALLLGLVLSACGGGGGGGGSGGSSGTPATSSASSATSSSSQAAAPTASISASSAATVNSQVILDGSASTAAAGRFLAFTWTLDSAPAGSASTIVSAGQSARFTPDLPGTYVVRLVVNDGFTQSAAASLTISSSLPATGYTKLDASGNALPDSASSWSCVRDNATRLEWEIKTAGTGLHSRSTGYTHYDDPLIYGASAVAASTNAAGFRSLVNAAGLCGHKDWRLPTYKELEGLLRAGTAPQINTSYFPDVETTGVCGYTCYGWYWAADASPYYTTQGWTTGFIQGYTQLWYRSDPLGVRLVRTGS